MVEWWCYSRDISEGPLLLGLRFSVPGSCETLTSRVGHITFSIPQVRGETDFYPSALEKGIRSEQALKLAMAEMYVQGVSTRKVSATSNALERVNQKLKRSTRVARVFPNEPSLLRRIPALLAATSDV